MKNKTVKFISIIVIMLLAVAIVGAIHIFPTPPNILFEKSIQSVVELKAFSESVGESYGTAVCVKSEDTLISNAHVVTYQKMGSVNVFDEYFVRLANEEDYHSVELVKYDLETDIAILKISDKAINLKPIKIGDSDAMTFGDRVYAIGNSSNYGLAITHGIISAPKINIAYEGATREVIQSDITISAGNSGGALLDEKGKLIGITTFRTKDIQGEVVYGFVYSIPINIIIDYLD